MNDICCECNQEIKGTKKAKIWNGKLLPMCYSCWVEWMKGGQKMNYLHISIPALEKCINPKSYGEICVRCNACGRIDRETQKECAIKMYKRQLQEQYNFDGWILGFEDVQKKNIESNIVYFKNKIAELEVENE